MNKTQSPQGSEDIADLKKELEQAKYDVEHWKGVAYERATDFLNALNREKGLEERYSRLKEEGLKNRPCWVCGVPQDLDEIECDDCAYSVEKEISRQITEARESLEKVMNALSPKRKELTSKKIASALSRADFLLGKWKKQDAAAQKLKRGLFK